MEKAKRSSSATKSKKPGKSSKASARKVTVAKANVTSKKKAHPKAKPKMTSPAKMASKPKRRKIRKYSPRSRYATFKIGDRVMFEHIQNWDSDSMLKSIIGTVVHKIDDKELGLRFIEVEFDLREHLPYIEDGIMLRRFVVK